MNSQRIQNLQTKLDTLDVGAFIITNTENIYYYTGFKGISEKGREAMVVVPKVGKVTLIVPRMYELQAQNLNSVQNNTISIEVLDKSESFINKLSKIVSSISKFLMEEYDLNIEEYNKLKEKLEGEFIKSDKLLYKLRSIKDTEEMKLIKKAVWLTDLTFEKIVDFLQTNDYTKFTEIDIAEKIRSISFELGGEGLSFRPIVACTKASAQPHYLPRSQKLQKNSILLIDLGVKYKGYGGDLTRTLFLGRADKEVKSTFKYVLHCNEKCIDLCKSGVKFSSIQKKAVEYFGKYGLEEYFIHSIGHGLGLDEHEFPFPGGIDDELREGMVFTIEPGLYFPDKYGIRIEDVLIISKNGVEVISNQTKQILLEI
ncbi:M24 family metallopeptidase [Candidatus Dojkabacteria bacterium]|nr:M24 family metallopeptidase [Candidatus Dojkabacteria bacterium]